MYPVGMIVSVDIMAIERTGAGEIKGRA